MKRGGPDARLEAMRRLAEGELMASVARALGVRENTIRDWRDSPDGARELAAARKAREASFADAVEGARRIVRENLERAAQVLADQLGHPDPGVCSLAARTLLDRGGVPRTERVESAPAVEEDLSTLTDEEFATLRAIKAKLKGKAAG